MTRVLVIEDDPTQRLLASAVLRSAGYEVHQAESGEAGLQIADDLLPDLIVCDVLMPGLNGYEFVEALKRDPRLCVIPVIMLTALSDRSHVRVGMTAGADDYLFKPVRAAELRHAATALLAKRDSQKAVFALSAEHKTNRALQQQEDALSERYELRLVQELSARWSEQASVNRDVTFDCATVLLVDAFGLVSQDMSAAMGVGQVIRRIFQATSDSLYLFGAQHLLLMGDDLLAVFPFGDTQEASSPAARAMRAAFGMQKMIRAAFQLLPRAADSAYAATPSATISIYTGALQLVHIDDPLHGGAGFLTAAGPALDAVKALNQNARACGWKISAPVDVMQGLAALAFVGRQVHIASSFKTPALDAIEVLPRL